MSETKPPAEMNVDPAEPGGDTHVEQVRVKCPTCKGKRCSSKICPECDDIGTVPAETKPKRKPRQVAKKTIVMQQEIELRAPAPTAVLTGTAWQDMTGADFGVEKGDSPTGSDVTLVQTFKDSNAAVRRLKAALEGGKIKGGTFRVAACGETMTPKVEPQQTNVVSF